MELLTPQLMWKGYDPSILPLATSILSDKTEGGKRFLTARFNGSFSTDGVSRVYVRAVLPIGKQSPTVIFAPDAYQSVNSVSIDAYTSAGYGVIVVDYAGERDDDPYYTIYPRSMEYANFKPEQLFTLPTDLRFNCWNTWAETLMRAVTFASSLVEVDSTRIAVVGEGVGSASALKSASVDERIKCVATLYTSSFTTNELSEQDRLTYQVAFSKEAYAPLVKVPTLMLVASNEQDDSIDDVFSTYERIPPSTGSLLSVSERTSHALAHKQKNNLKNWLHKHLSGEGDFPTPPTFTLTAEERKLTFNITLPQGLSEPELFVAPYERAGALRNWRLYKPTRRGDVFVAKVDVYDVKKPIIAFVNAVQKGVKGLSVTSNAIIKTPGLLGVDETPITNNRLVYSGEMGKDDWIVMSDNVKKNMLSVMKGPFGINGVSSSTGNLSTFKIGDPASSGKNGWILQLMVYSMEEQDVSFVVTECISDEDKTKYVEFTRAERLYPADNWRTLNLSERDFKSSYGGQLNWDDAVYLQVKSDSPIAIARVLWV